MLLELERSHGFGSHISMGFPFVDQIIPTFFKLVVSQFAVAKCLRRCLSMMQRTVNKSPIRSHLRNPVFELDSLVAF